MIVKIHVFIQNFLFIMKFFHRLVDENCYPYQANQSSCPFRLESDLIKDGCKPVVPERRERYKVGPPVRLAQEKDVMYDIFHSGPIQG